MSRARLWSRLCIGCALAVTGMAASGEARGPLDGEGEAIVVTAQRRPERPQDVPISLTPIDGEALERRQATDLAALGKLVPSLVMTRTGAFTQPFLRGVGKRSTLGVENSVATYVDGVYLASSIGALLDLRGIARVEVLNGPQGTLFGRNATGGVIQVVTRDPGAGSGGEVLAEAGSYAHVRGDAYLTGGNERLAANLSVSLSRNGGYGTNLFTGRTDQGRVDHSLVARSKSIWRPGGSLAITLAGDYQDVDQDFSQRPVIGYPPLGAPRIQDFRDGDQDAPSRYHFRYGGASVKVDGSVGALGVTSLSAWRRMKADYGTDLDQGPLALLAGVPHAIQNQLSQELQIQSPRTAPVAWIAGLYYIRIEERYDPSDFSYGGSYSARLGGRIRQSLFDTGRVSSLAGYGQATMPIGASSRLTAGLRYTIEERSVRARGEQAYDNPPLIRPIPGLPLTTDPPYRNRRRFREPTWRLALDRKLSAGVMAYLAASRGVQSGGWNLQTPQTPAFAPETLDAFEAGLKFADRSGRLRADASLFYYDYADLQVSAFTPLGSVTTNAASADIFGLDLQLQAKLGARTEIGLGAQRLDAHFNRFPNATCTNYDSGAALPYLPVPCDVTGNRMPFAPRLKVNLGADHRLPLGRGGSVSLSASLAYNGGYVSEADNVVRQPAFATVDVSAEWNPGRRMPTLRLWALNLTNARYFDSLVTFPTTGVLQRPAAPRRLGITAGFRF